MAPQEQAAVRGAAIDHRHVPVRLDPFDRATEVPPVRHQQPVGFLARRFRDLHQLGRVAGIDRQHPVESIGIVDPHLPKSVVAEELVSEMEIDAVGACRSRVRIDLDVAEGHQALDLTARQHQIFSIESPADLSHSGYEPGNPEAW